MLTITEAHAGQRIDNFLITHLKGVPRTRIYRAIRNGEVRVNKGRINAMYKLKAGDQVRIPPIRHSEAKAMQPSEQLVQLLAKAIVFDHPDFLVVNKPAGLAVHGGSGLKIGLIEAFRYARPDIEQLHLVHRLDRDTSGCLLLAKNRKAMVRLHEMIRHHEIQKEYDVLVRGHWPKGLNEIDQPLLPKIVQGEKMTCIDVAGKPARTLFSIIQYVDSATLLRATLITGRMHQIRAHTAFAGHPIIGDRKYGDGKKASRLFLHAKRLSFHFPHEDSRLYSIEAKGFDLDSFTSTI